MSNNTTRAAGPGGVGGVDGDAYSLAYTGAEIDAAITGWQTAQNQADATAADIAQGKKAITGAGLVTGTMEAGGGSYDPTDPMSVYKATRPADWLPMPEPAEGEAYLLYLVPPTDQALFAVHVMFTGGAAIQLGDAAPIALTSETKFETTFNWDACANPTSDGFKQVMIKISGNGITGLSFEEHSLKPNYTDYFVVDCRMRLPRLESFGIGDITIQYFSLDVCNIANMKNMFAGCNLLTAVLSLDTSQAISTNSMFSGCYLLAAIPTLDTSQTTDMGNMFYNCSSLTTIPALDTSQVTGMNGMFYNCSSLTSIPALDTSKVTNMGTMFSGCNSLIAIPALDTSKTTNMDNMFKNCHSMVAIPLLDTSQATGMNSMFYGCFSLTAIPAINTSRATSMTSMFSGCYSLATVSLLDTSQATNLGSIFSNCRLLSKISYGPSETIRKTQTLSLLNCSLSRQAIINFFETLPTAAGSSPKLTLSKNPGVSALTSADKAIATGKGWTLTL